MDPEASSLPAPAAFIPGSPVFDAGEAARNQMLDEQRELEKMWARKKRPKDVSVCMVIEPRIRVDLGFVGCLDAETEG